MKRRGLLTLAAALPARATALRAQTAATARPRIGVLSFGAAPSATDPDPIASFRQSLRDLGHDEGRSLLIEYRSADGQTERLAALVRRAAGHVGRILKGAHPAELAIERPSVLALVINLKTARALGMKIPQSLPLRAGKVIQ